METHTAGKLKRQPLRSRNIPAVDLPRFKPARSEIGCGKENNESTVSAELHLPPEALSLAEELGEARQRKQRLRLERDRTERILRDRSLVLEKQMREAERRTLQQMELEVKLQRLLCLFELRSLIRFDRINSLREQEEEEKRKEGGNYDSETGKAETSSAKEKVITSHFSL